MLGCGAHVPNCGPADTTPVDAQAGAHPTLQRWAPCRGSNKGALGPLRDTICGGQSTCPRLTTVLTQALCTAWGHQQALEQQQRLWNPAGPEPTFVQSYPIPKQTPDLLITGGRSQAHAPRELCRWK